MKLSLLALSLLLSLISTPSFGTKVGLKTFRELPSAYSTVLGVPTTNPAIQTIIKKVSSRLPQKGEVEEMSSPMILAVYELSGAFCSTFMESEVNKPAPERLLFKSVDFKQGTKQFSMALQRGLIADMADAFWFRQPTETEQTELEYFFSQSISSSGAAIGESRNIAFMLCTYFGTSLQFLVD